MLPVILTVKPQYEKALILANISFFSLLDLFFVNDLNMYLHAPSNIECIVSTGVDLHVNVQMYINIARQKLSKLTCKDRQTKRKVDYLFPRCHTLFFYSSLLLQFSVS